MDERYIRAEGRGEEVEVEGESKRGREERRKRRKRREGAGDHLLSAVESWTLSSSSSSSLLLFSLSLSFSLSLYPYFSLPPLSPPYIPPYLPTMDVVAAVSGYIAKMVTAGDSLASSSTKMKILLLDSETVRLRLTT